MNRAIDLRLKKLKLKQFGSGELDDLTYDELKFLVYELELLSLSDPLASDTYRKLRSKALPRLGRRSSTAIAGCKNPFIEPT